MNTDLSIRSALASLPETFDDATFLRALQRREMTAHDALLALERALLDGYVARAPSSVLSKLPKAAASAAPGNLQQP